MSNERLLTEREAIEAFSSASLLSQFDIGGVDLGKQRAACFGFLRRNTTKIKWLDLSKQLRSMLDGAVAARGKEGDDRKRGVDARAAHIDRICRAVVKKDPMILLVGHNYLIGNLLCCFAKHSPAQLTLHYRRQTTFIQTAKFGCLHCVDR